MWNSIKTFFSLDTPQGQRKNKQVYLQVGGYKLPVNVGDHPNPENDLKLISDNIEKLVPYDCFNFNLIMKNGKSYFIDTYEDLTIDLLLSYCELNNQTLNI